MNRIYKFLGGGQELGYFFTARFLFSISFIGLLQNYRRHFGFIRFTGGIMFIFYIYNLLLDKNKGY